MRRTVVLSTMAFCTLAATVFSSTPALSHGYINSPPSRQANCAAGKVANCGAVIYEPQSVEGAKGQRNCHAGDSRWAPLSDESKAWPATSVGSSASFTWRLTARHATSTWEYFIGGTKIATFNDGGKIPGATVTHSVNLAGYSGRQKVLAIWNIADTPMAFYSCVDLQIGGGGTPDPTPTPTPTRTVTPTPTPTTTPTQQPGGTWAAGTAYTSGNTVTYGGSTYKCVQPHTAISGWEPPNVPALWQKV
jgi:predicted carbohydrate-binding protein with CBM5 and CBM33 domain